MKDTHPDAISSFHYLNVRPWQLPIEGSDQFADQPTFWGDQTGHHQRMHDSTDGALDRIHVRIKRLLGLRVMSREAGADSRP